MLLLVPVAMDPEQLVIAVRYRYSRFYDSFEFSFL